MVLIAREMGWGLGPLDLRRFAATIFGGPDLRQARIAAPLQGEILTARSLASVGAAGLVALPLLLTASPFLNAPVAGPAAIALGYLAAARSLALEEKRRAAAWSFTVHSGLVLWTALYVLVATGPLSWGGLAPLLLAPVFAAAPALARPLLARKRRPIHAAAHQDAERCDRLAPEEAVFFIDRSGNLLAATKAGTRSLGLDGSSAAAGQQVDISRFFRLADRPLLLNAIAKRTAGDPPAEIALAADAERGDRRHFLAVLGSGRNGAITLSLRTMPAVEPGPAEAPVACRSTTAGIEPAAPRALRSEIACDLREAIAFALRRAEQKADAKDVRLLVKGETPAVMAACGRRLCRQIAALLLESAVEASQAGGEVHVEARGLRGAVLLRVTCGDENGAPGAVERLRAALASTSVGEMVDAAGGTILAGDTGRRASVSVRLASAASGSAECRPISVGVA